MPGVLGGVAAAIRTEPVDGRKAIEGRGGEVDISGVGRGHRLWNEAIKLTVQY
jgi:hypothetical protein